jgi:TolB-like protein/class 3 adenylate cyclase/Tfp pilus assembly protein PilF
LGFAENALPRSAAGGAGLQFRFGNHLLDLDRRELCRGGEPVALEPQVFDLLVHLVQNRDRVVSKDELLEAVWGGRIVSESALTSRITAVRKAIGDTGAAQHLIRTVPRRGIRFIGDVREEREAPPASSAAPRLSIVVLPFVNLSRDPDEEYFADGVTDDLTTDLSRIAGALVIARSTAFTYKGKPVDVKQLGRELGVRYALEGSVRRAADRVQVNVQLIDAESGAHVWADRFEADRTSLAQAHREITGRLAWALNLELVRDVGRRIEQENRIDPAAQDLVMLGWAWWHRPRSAAAMQEARRAFERALEIDPRSIDARVGLARVLTVDLVGNFAPRPKTDFRQEGQRIERLLLEAIEGDPNNPRARATMGRLRWVQNRLVEARIEFETAIALDPNDSFAHVQLALTLLFSGEPAAAIPEAEKAIRLSPRDPQLWGYYWPLGFCRLLLNDAEMAIEPLTQARAANPRNWLIHFLLAAALGLRGDVDGARAALAESLKRNPDVDSLAAYRAFRPWGSPQYWALFEETAAVGLRRAGLLDEASELDRVLATVLFTDIVDSTRRAAEIGDRAWRLLLDRHDDAVRQELVQFRGREVKTLGDGFLATFDSPARAVRCAAAIIDRLRPLGIAVRAGLHTGEVETKRDEVGGIAVHIAARIAEMAGDGEILVSGTVRDLVAGSGLGFDDRGDHALKGLPEPLRLFAARV